MERITVKTEPIEGQKPGTSGLRKKTHVFMGPHYLENFVQAIWNGIGGAAGKTFVLGGDGRYDTAALAAAEAARRTGAPERVWVATGRDFPDALSAAAGAVRDQAVVLLTEGLAGAVPGATAAALGDLGACASSLRLVGGTAAISGGHASALLGVVGC